MFKIKLLTSYLTVKGSSENYSSDATGDRYARLLGAGNGPQSFLVSNQDSRGPHPALRCAK